MIRTIIIFIFLMSVIELNSQNLNDNWIFGFTDTIYNETCAKVLWHNDKIGVSFKYVNTELNFEATNAAISDNEGNLLLFTNGCSIANSNYEIIKNGDNINPGIVHDKYCANTGYIVPNGAMFLPLDNDKYILLHIGLKTDTSVNKYGLLYYTIIRVIQNEYVVTEKNIALTETPVESFSVIKHANGGKWWLIAPENESNKYYRFLINRSGVEEQQPQILGIDIPDEYCKVSGLSRFSPNGKKFLRYNRSCGYFLFDFDRCSGLLSNVIFESVGYFVDDIASDFIFSPDSKYIYISKINHYRFASDIYINALYKIIIDSIGKKADPFIVRYLYPDLRLNRFFRDVDSSLYVLNDHSNDVFYFIDKHDDTHLQYFPLPALNARSIPYFANFNLSKYECDSISSTSRIDFDNKPVIFPNPFSDKVTIKIPNLISKSDIKILTIKGELIYDFENISLPITLNNLIQLKQGIYLFEIKSGNKIYFLKGIKIQK